MKARRFTVGSTQIQQIKTDNGENEIGRPGGDPGRDPIAFAKREKEMGEKIHRENENDGGSNAGKNTAARVTDAQRRGDAHHHQTFPRQGEAILKMRSKRREQSCGKIGIEPEVFAQLRQAEKFRTDIGAAETKRRFAPVVDLE